MSADASRASADRAALTPGTVRPRSIGSARCEWLVDNAAAYDRLFRAVCDARERVWVVQLAFDADCAAFGPADGREPPRVLARALLEAAGARGVDVRVLLNASFVLDTAKALRRWFADAGADPRRVEVRGFSHFSHFQHAKIVIVDGAEAFFLGSPFVNGYWDDGEHRPVDARRTAHELGGRPVHDLSFRLTGPAVHELEGYVAELWNETGSGGPADSAPLRPHRPGLPPRDGGDGLELVRTVPRGLIRRFPEGATEVLDACLDGIAGAESLLYVEHQYLTSRPVIAALSAALARRPALEVVAVLNQNPDLTSYHRWQTSRLRSSGLLRHPRVGLFSLWSAGAPDPRTGRTPVNQIFVHSKALAADDRWALVGSANLDGVSLLGFGSDFEGALGQRVFRHTRNYEVSVVLRDGANIAELRTRLWAEHLGLAPTAVTDRPAGGWLGLWRERAARNVRALNAGSPMAGFVLPYSTRPTPARQLADVGVRRGAAALDLHFNPGRLLAHLTPGWVRNMFA